MFPKCSSLVTHLQYADVILFIRNDLDSIRGIKNILQCFELLFRLRINFHKSSIHAYGEKSADIASWASESGCQVGGSNFKYLVSMLWSSHSQCSYWKSLVQNVKSKHVNGMLILYQLLVD